MPPTYKSNYIKNKAEIFSHLLNDLNWLEVTPARKEFFMSENDLEYTYGSGASARTYKSSLFTPPIMYMMVDLNLEFKTNYNVCFLNRYDNLKNHLGWHSDDSFEMNIDHDICVVSFGAEREIWWKNKDYKGPIPKENRQLLEDGSLFVMPAGFQKNHYHKIPKADKEVGVRISLTFRNYKEVDNG